MAKMSANTVPGKPTTKAPRKKRAIKAPPAREEKSAAFDFGGFQPEVIQLVRSFTDIAPRADESVGEYQHSCEVFRNLKIEEADVCFVEFSATEVAGKETVISVEATYMVVITAPGTATRAQRDAFTEFFVKHIVWQRFRDFCDFTLAQGGESLPMPLALAGGMTFKTF